MNRDSLRRYCETRKDLSPELFADTLLTEVMNWTGTRPGGSLEDDLTLIVVDVDFGSPEASDSE